MEVANARASIELCGNVLRYAELERHGARYRLLRLGRHDFEVDLVEAIHRGTRSEHWQALTEVLGDLFDTSAASRLAVTLHPPAAHSFFTALPATLQGPERARHLRREAGVLMQSDAPRPLRLTADRIYSEEEGGETIEWLHVLALEEDVQERIDLLVGALPFETYRLMLSTHAVASVIGQVERREGAEGRRGPYTLAVGWYPSHAEYVLWRDGQWRFGRYVDAPAPSDIAYYAAALLQRLQVEPAVVGRLFTYGEAETTEPFDPLATALRLTPEPLRPSQLVRLDADAVDFRIDAASLTPCVGAAL